MTMEQLIFFTNIEIAILGTIVFLFLVQLAYYAGIYAKPLRMAKRM
ncbi:MAG TPA: glycosyl transferase, partial [Porphyromonadaceae bacterium]|nr:glycosyl transferase [Porphyromonadaceae bacterium]